MGTRYNTYSINERIKILQYIIETDGYHRVKGNAVWMELQDRKILPSRTWQSLREHFRKQIYPRLHYAEYGLTPEQIQKFHDVMLNKQKRPQNENSEETPEESIDYFSDEEYYKPLPNPYARKKA